VPHLELGWRYCNGNERNGQGMNQSFDLMVSHGLSHPFMHLQRVWCRASGLKDSGSSHITLFSSFTALSPRLLKPHKVSVTSDCRVNRTEIQHTRQWPIKVHSIVRLTRPLPRVTSAITAVTCSRRGTQPYPATTVSIATKKTRMPWRPPIGCWV
jgi:hypothetical protein